MRRAFYLIFVFALCLSGVIRVRGACDTCTNFRPGTSLGVADAAVFTELSGIASSPRNPGVLWAHNDGSNRRVFALSTNGAYLASFSLRTEVADLEDIAVGPGPMTGGTYLYVGDIGGGSALNQGRGAIQILRVPEPSVDLAWAADPQTGAFDTVEPFTLFYPDGSYDAEALMVDPVSGEIFVITKETSNARVYRASLTNASPDTPIVMQFVRSIPFGQVSAGDISADGRQIVMRREDLAWSWSRCEDELIAVALSRPGANVPIIGPPQEPNGEAIAFLRNGSGYVTVSEGTGPNLYFFQSQCPLPPRLTLLLTDQSTLVGGGARFDGFAIAYPAPVYTWRHNGVVVSGQGGPSLILPQVTMAMAGQYELTVSNHLGTQVTTAALVVRLKPDLRITEVQSSTAPSPNLPTADWWELTSFESQPVDLSGWRFNDNLGGLTDPFVLGNGLTIHPGESIVFVEDISAAQFRNWWGAANVPLGIQIVSYSGSGLSLGASGDGLRLWSNMSGDAVASVDFGAAANGVSFNYDPVTGQFGQQSQVGVNGVFRALSSNDIGSPGTILAPRLPPGLTASVSTNVVRIDFTAAVGRQYVLEDWSDGTWLPTGDVLTATNNGPVHFEKIRSAGSRIYRLQVR